MAPGPPPPLASLSKFVQNSQKGNSGWQRYANATARRDAPVKNDALNAIFDDEDDEGSESDSDSDNDASNNNDFMAKLNGTFQPKSSSNSVRKPVRRRDEEIEDSDVERNNRVASNPKSKTIQKLSDSASDETSDTDSESEAGSSSESVDSDADTPEVSAMNEKTTKNGQTTPDSGSDSESRSTSKAEKRVPKVKEVESEKEDPGTSSSGESDNSGSESDSDDESVAGSVKKAESGAGDAPSDTSSEADSTSDEEESNESGEKTSQLATVKANGKAVANGVSKISKTDKTTLSASKGLDGSEKTSAATSGASSSATSDESDEEESAEEASDEEMADQSLALIDRRDSSKDLAIPEFVGSGFVLRKVENNSDGEDIAQFFSQAKMEGKQVWYFTAPASIPISVVEKLEIPIDTSRGAEAIFSHDGDNYGIALDEAASSSMIQLLIPKESGSRYETGIYPFPSSFVLLDLV
jgi:hypothetical protein